MLKDIVNGHWTQVIRIRNHNPGGLDDRINRVNSSSANSVSDSILLVHATTLCVT